MTNFLSLGIVTLLLALGQLLFKQVGLSIQGRQLVEGLLILATSPAFYAALAVYGIATMLWIFILSRISLSQAYPWVAVGVALVPFLAWLVFDERVGSTYWLGVAFIMFGVLLTQRQLV